MNKCLITKLKTSTGNENLLKYSEFRMTINYIDNPSSVTQSFTIQYDTPTKLEIVGDGYFTDSTLLVNNGKSITIDANILTKVYFSNGNYKISINNKYNLKGFSILEYGANNKVVNINDLMYSEKISPNFFFYQTKCFGDLSVIKNMNVINVNVENSRGIYGDISSITNKSFIQFNVQGTEVTGNLATFANKTSINILRIGQSKIIGNLSNISNLINLNELSIDYNSNFDGNIDNIINLKNLKLFYAKGIKLTGDLSQISPVLCYLDCLFNNSSAFTWTKRNNNNTIFSIRGYPYVSDIDKMLQDFSECTIPSQREYNNKIEVRGTRTSASDEALAILQSKGYTVSIKL